MLIARRAPVASFAQLVPVASVAAVLLLKKVHPVERIASVGERRASVARVTQIAPVERLMSVGVVERVAQVNTQEADGLKYA